ncbi:NAD(P)H-binding protein [Brachybacterium hainanense]|uniref:NAD(P)H-binding protein n=1 Tax=Brachybacterium hainanense TaxID=1541174 RepID=A0ABV6RFW5_9MICO
MHHLVIGEGQIGREIIDQARDRGDAVTVLRRSEAAPAPGVRRIRGDVLDPAALGRAIEDADAVHAAFHAPYDSRVWRRELPPRELAVLDAAARHDAPVIFPESMYGFQGEAARLAEGAAPSPRDAKGEIRVQLLETRRRHAARTASIVASDLIGPTAVGTGSAVACSLLMEQQAAGRRGLILGDPDAPHTLTFIPDLAAAMLHAARYPERLPADAILHAPSAPARSQRELARAAADLLEVPFRPPLTIPRLVLRALSPFHPLARELSGIAGIWYGPCRLEPGLLTTQEQLVPTPWEEALARTVHAMRHPSPRPTTTSPGR